MPWLSTYVWGRDIEIGAWSCWGMGVFVLVLSNINIVWQKSLSALIMDLLFIQKAPKCYDIGAAFHILYCNFLLACSSSVLLL